MKYIVLLNLVFGFLYIQAAEFPYSADKTEFSGFLEKPASLKGKVPAVIIVHDWMGPSDFTQKKAKEIAAMGYLAFAADIYGKGVRPKDAKEAGELAGKYKGNRAEFRKRVRYAYDVVSKMSEVNNKKIIIIGYCFGGTAALELGRSGAELAGIVSFHGGLSNPAPQDAKNIKAKTLILHGAIDPYVPMEEVAAFQKEMNEAKVDYQFISYSGAVHAFAVPKAGNDIKTGAAYNAVADKRSWDEFKKFLNEL